LLRGTGVHFHQARATRIDWRGRHVTLSDGTQLGYDRLVYALGSQTDRTTPGVQENALALEGMDSAAQMRVRLDALAAGSEVVVVGGGLTGTELVFEVAERYPHLRWTLVALEAYERGYAPAARDYFLAGLMRRGITMRTGVNVQAVEAGHLVTNRGDVPFDLCLWAGSFRAAPLGRESGLAVNERAQVLVDESLRSVTTPDIYVAGDSAALPISYQPYLVMGCKTAMPQGIHAAENLLAELRGEEPQPLSYDYQATCVSLGRQDGLVQMLKPDGEPSAFFMRGRAAAWVKEIICRFTVFTLQLERHVDFYSWVVPTRRRSSPNPIQEQSAAHGL
jgi:NADH dehydrogenase FAD-containing subunit